MTAAPDEGDENTEGRISAGTLRVMDRALERVEVGEVGEELDPGGIEGPDGARE